MTRTFEDVVSFGRVKLSYEPLITCSACGAFNIRRIIHPCTCIHRFMHLFLLVDLRYALGGKVLEYAQGKII